MRPMGKLPVQFAPEPTTNGVLDKFQPFTAPRGQKKQSRPPPKQHSIVSVASVYHLARAWPRCLSNSNASLPFRVVVPLFGLKAHNTTDAPFCRLVGAASKLFAMPTVAWSA